MKEPKPKKVDLRQAVITKVEHYGSGKSTITVAGKDGSAYSIFVDSMDVRQRPFKA